MISVEYTPDEQPTDTWTTILEIESNNREVVENAVQAVLLDLSQQIAATITYQQYTENWIGKVEIKEKPETVRWY